ncbi:hypothetical protein GEMRC1_007712 [Eukaryota sp. GEM-RC1]
MIPNELLSQAPPLPSDPTVSEALSTEFAKYEALLSSPKWKERVEACDSIIDSVSSLQPSLSSPFISCLAVYLHSVNTFSNTNTQVISKGMTILFSLANVLPESESLNPHLVELLVPFAADKLTDTRAKLASAELLRTLCRHCTPGLVFSRIHSCISSIKLPKAHAEIIKLMSELTESFALVSVDIPSLMKFIESMLDSPNAAVRQATIQLICSMKKVLGPSLSNHLTGIKPALMSNIESELNSVEGCSISEPTETIRCIDSADIPTLKSAVTTTHSAPKKPKSEEPAKTSRPAPKPKTRPPTAKPSATKKQTDHLLLIFFHPPLPSPSVDDALASLTIDSFDITKYSSDLNSAKWKERVQACDAILEVIQSTSAFSSHFISSMTVFLHSVNTFSNTNTQVIAKGMTILTTLLESMDEEQKANPHIVPVLTHFACDKLTDTRAKTASADLLRALCKHCTPGLVFSSIYSCLPSIKLPKTQAEVVSLMSEIAESFALVSIDVSKLVHFCSLAFDHPNAAVRQSVVKLLCSMKKILGDPLLTLLTGFKPAAMTTIEAELAKVTKEAGAEPIVAIKTLKSEEPITSSAVPTLEIPRSDVSGQFTSKLMSNLNSRNWKERLKAVGHIDEIIASANDCIDPSLGPDLPNALRLRLGDSNANIATQTVHLIGRIISAIGTGAIDRYSKILFVPVVACLSVNKPLLRAAAQETMDKWIGLVGMEKLMPYFPELINADSVLQRRDVIQFFDTHLNTCASPPTGLLPIVKSLLNRAQDGDKAIRHAAENALSSVAMFVGGNKICNMIRKLPISEQDRLKPLASKLESITASVQPASATKRAQSPKKIVEKEPEPEEKVIRKNAPIKKPLSRAQKSRDEHTSSPVESPGLLPVPANSTDYMEAKEKRWFRERKGVTKWGSVDAVSRSKVEYMEQLKQFLHMIANQKLMDLMTSIALPDVHYEKSKTSSQNLTILSHADVILRWCSLKLTDDQPAITRRILELLTSLFNHFKSISYRLTDYELSASLPYIIDSLKSSKEPIRNLARDLVHTSCFVCPASRVFSLLIDAFALRSPKLRVELLEVCSSFLSRHGPTVGSPHKLGQIIREISTDQNLKPASVKFAALCLSLYPDDNLSKMIADQSFFDLVMHQQSSLSSETAHSHAHVPPTDEPHLPPSVQDLQLPATPPTPIGFGHLESSSQRDQKDSGETDESSVSFGDSLFLAGATPRLPRKSKLASSIVGLPSTSISSIMDSVRNCVDFSDLNTFIQHTNNIKNLHKFCSDSEHHIIHPHVDSLMELLTNSLMQYFKTMIRLYNQLPHSSDLEAETLNTSISVISDGSLIALRIILFIFNSKDTGGRLVSATQLKHFVSSVCTFVVYGEFRKLGSYVNNLIRQVNRVMLVVLDHGNRNVLYSVLLNLSQPCVSRQHVAKYCSELSPNEIEQFESLILKCLTKLTTSLIDWSDGDCVDFDLLLRDVHLFLVSYDRERLSDKSDLKLKLIKTLLEKITNQLGQNVSNHLTLVPSSGYSPLLGYIEELLSFSVGEPMNSPIIPPGTIESRNTAVSVNDTEAVVKDLVVKILNNTDKSDEFREQLILFAKQHSGLDVTAIIKQCVPDNQARSIISLLPPRTTESVQLPAQEEVSSQTTVDQMSEIASRFRDKLSKLQSKTTVGAVSSSELLSRLSTLRSSRPETVVYKPPPSNEQLHDTFSQLQELQAKTPQPSSRTFGRDLEALPPPLLGTTDATSSRMAMLKERIQNLKKVECYFLSDVLYY